MPNFISDRRWQPAYSPFKKETFGRNLLRGLKIVVKGPLFTCRMCGKCLLQETAFICPMECLKGLSNGPCGGSTLESCYIDKTRLCIWYKVYDRSFKIARFMAEVPGVWEPEPILKRMETADKDGNAQEEDVQITLELVRKIKDYEKLGIHGLHIMPFDWENIVPRVVTEAGLLP